MSSSNAGGSRQTIPSVDFRSMAAPPRAGQPLVRSDNEPGWPFFELRGLWADFRSAFTRCLQDGSVDINTTQAATVLRLAEPELQLFANRFSSGQLQIHPTALTVLNWFGLVMARVEPEVPGRDRWMSIVPSIVHYNPNDFYSPDLELLEVPSNDNLVGHHLSYEEANSGWSYRTNFDTIAPPVDEPGLYQISRNEDQDARIFFDPRSYFLVSGRFRNESEASLYLSDGAPAIGQAYDHFLYQDPSSELVTENDGFHDPSISSTTRIPKPRRLADKFPAENPPPKLPTEKTGAKAQGTGKAKPKPSSKFPTKFRAPNDKRFLEAKKPTTSVSRDDAAFLEETPSFAASEPGSVLHNLSRPMVPYRPMDNEDFEMWASALNLAVPRRPCLMCILRNKECIRHPDKEETCTECSRKKQSCEFYYAPSKLQELQSKLSFANQHSFTGIRSHLDELSSAYQRMRMTEAMLERDMADVRRRANEISSSLFYWFAADKTGYFARGAVSDDEILDRVKQKLGNVYKLDPYDPKNAATIPFDTLAATLGVNPRPRSTPLFRPAPPLLLSDAIHRETRSFKRKHRDDSKDNLGEGPSNRQPVLQSPLPQPFRDFGLGDEGADDIYGDEDEEEEEHTPVPPSKRRREH
ncbi:hypothetical protein CPB83DRAFT_840586 [Crepidotus variabilis]|uniref:Zn(2)-C6 fungal-type domain-containing protein n=1 Tax=Crepidotus variabilis TaxID=179855 RepID=A0A9P6JIW1_9AGAR|nr:hypothetical protein CPB83DRAFT_840586 [Crepidotus variabilis]